jgi:hypothetical protein
MNITDTTPALSTTDLVDVHLDAYAEADPDRRRELVERVWATDGRLADPPFDGEGHDAIAGLTDVVLQHFPDHRFRRTTAVDEHHGVGRYGWELVGPDGAVAVTGLDIVEVADGRIARITGFFGDAEPLAG